MNQLHLSVRALLLSGAFLLLASPIAQAGSATWNLNPVSGNWNDPANWTPATVPNGPDDVATFGVSNQTNITFSAETEVGSIVFSSGASAYTIGAAIFPGGTTISGPGIVNNSGVVQTFALDTDRGVILGFENGATAGAMTAFSGGDFTFTGIGTGAGTGNFVITSGATMAGSIVFSGGSASADQATILVTSGPGQIHGFADFGAGATAGSATITAQGASTSDGIGTTVTFNEGSNAGTATVTASGATAAGPNGHGVIAFTSNASADNATLIATAGINGGNGGHLSFTNTATGGNARAEILGNGQMALNFHNGGMSIGSIEGDGLILLGSRQLTLSGSLSTTFSGPIQGNGGSLVRAGTGTLTLSGVNTYTAGTIVNSGSLLVANTAGSGTGTGAVTVNGGTLGGSGIISGAVTVASGAFLAPAAGTNKQLALTLQSNLTLQSGATYTYTFKARKNQARTDLLIANGVTVNGATIALKGKTQGTLTPGTVLTLISNTGASAIVGTFSNLADGAIVNVNGNNLQASYTGGDGNDLTLTVVP